MGNATTWASHFPFLLHRFLSKPFLSVPFLFLFFFSFPGVRLVCTCSTSESRVYLRSDLVDFRDARIECKGIARSFARVFRGRRALFLFFFSKTSSKIPLLLRFSLPIFNRSRETHPSAMIRVYFPFHVYSARSKEEFLLSCTILRFYFPIHVYIYMFRWGCVTTDVIKVKSDLLYFIRGTYIYVSLPLRLFYANLYPMYIEYARLISVSFVRGKIKFIFSFREMTNDTRRV